MSNWKRCCSITIAALTATALSLSSYHSFVFYHATYSFSLLFLAAHPCLSPTSWTRWSTIHGALLLLHSLRHWLQHVDIPNRSSKRACESVRKRNGHIYWCERTECAIAIELERHKKAVTPSYRLKLEWPLKLERHRWTKLATHIHSQVHTGNIMPGQCAQCVTQRYLCMFFPYRRPSFILWYSMLFSHHS